MALQVTQANPNQTINGVVQAQPNQTISGVVSASPPASTLKVAPVNNGAANYNPQASTVTPTLSTANPQVGAANPQTGAVSPQGAQTFQFADGSVYNGQGQLVSGPTPSPTPTYNNTVMGQAQQASPAVALNTPTPAVTQPSTSLTNDTGYSDVLKMLNNNLNNMDKLFSNLSNYATVSPEEKAQQQKVVGDQANVTKYQGAQAGIINPSGQPMDLPFLTGSAQNQLFNAQLQQQIDSATLNYMQGNRQFAFNSASTIFDAGQKNLMTMLDVYSKAAPQNIGSNYNPTTGQLTAIMRNPLSGATYTGDLGNIGAQHQFTSTNITTDPMTGGLTFVGTTSDGKVVTQPIGGSAAFNSGGSTSPLQGNGASGNYIQTSNPQVSTVGGLIGNWTSGNPNQLPGAGYQQAVYQQLGQSFGMPINAQTPTSTLVSNVPAVSQAIAKAEGYGQANNVGSRINNPGNILWANQPNATAYTASNGYTYAKFNTAQDGWNAMNDLVARKLGASQTPSPQNIQDTINNLPPALSSPGTVKYLNDGTPFFDGNQLTGAQIPMAQAIAKQTTIPYIVGDNAGKLNNITVAQQNLKDLSDYAQKTLISANFLSKPLNFLQGRLSDLGGGTIMTNFDTYRNLAIASLQGLVGGSGSGLRITAGEIATQINNLPKYTDSPGQAQTKIDNLNSQLNKWISQIMPTWKPSLGVSATPVDYTATLNNLMGQ